MIELRNAKSKRVIKVPTSVNDITPEILTKLTENVVLSKYHALVAICWNVSFANVMFQNKQQHQSAQVIPLMVKANLPEDCVGYDWLNVGKKVILTRSAIEMGVHVHIPHSASINSLERYFREISKSEKITREDFIDPKLVPSGNFILIEFKVVNVSDISGVVENDTLSEDPFLVNE